MISKELERVLKKQHYFIVGDHSAVQICRWTKKSLRNEGNCYKQKFYGIKSHECCQMSPSVMWCQNSCVHCWRAIENTIGKDMKKVKINSPKEIIKGCIEGQRELLSGFKGFEKTDLKKLKQAQNPTQFAISLSGEPTLYPKLGELINELRKRGNSTFLVTNGLLPEKLLELKKQNALPTQLYVSLNTINKEEYDKWHKSKQKNAWEKLNKTLEILSKLGTRTVIRITLVRDLNMSEEDAKGFAKLIEKACPDFIEVKGFMSVGYARKRLGYGRMPDYKEVKNFSKKILKHLKDYQFLDEQELSRVMLLGKDKKRMKIKKSEI